MNEEIWKDIPGYENLYQVSNLGRVKSLKYNKEKILKTSKNRYGYLLAHLHKNRRTKTYTVHRLVIETFMGQPIDEDYYSINHIDEDKENNRLENLQYCTCKYNLNYGSRNEKISKKLVSNYNASRKSVIGVNKINGYIVEFSSIAETGRFMNIKTSNICACCQGKIKSAGGYYWFYANKEDRENV